MLTLFLVILVASYYQLKIDERRLVVAPIAAISGKCDGTSTKNDVFYGKSFELFQMRPLGCTSSSTDDPEVDVNGNRQRCGDSSDMENGVQREFADPNTSTSVGEKSEMGDYQMETGSCAGGTGTYEAKQSVGEHQAIPWFIYLIPVGLSLIDFTLRSFAPTNTIVLRIANQCQGNSKH